MVPIETWHITGRYLPYGQLTESGMEGYHYSIVYTSPDGENWTEQNYQNNSVLYKAAWGNGKFVAVGSNGIILTSPDGITPWTEVRSKKGYNLTDIVWDGARFVVSGAEVLYSEDGVRKKWHCSG